MPQLTDTRKVVKSSIPSIEGSELTIRDGVLGEDLEWVYGEGKTSQIEVAMRALSKMIEDWNLTDTEEKKLPITLDNVKKMNSEDILAILQSTSFTSQQGNQKKT